MVKSKMLQNVDESEGECWNITKIIVVWGGFFVNKWYNRGGGSTKKIIETIL